jgi:envelope integrity protein B
MLNCRFPAAMIVAVAFALPAAAQEMQPHRAVYTATMLERGKPGVGAPGTYAFELKMTCDSYIMIQRLRLEIDGPRGSVVSEQQSQMTESRDGKKLHFDHRSTVNGRVANQFKGEAVLGDDGRGQAHYSEPEGQTVALPAGTMFPMAMTRATIQHARANDGGFDALFYYGEKVKPPQAVNVLIGRVPKRLADLKIPEGADALVNGHSRIYYRGGFFDAQPKDKGEQAAYEMSSLVLDNSIELYGTHEEGESGIEYRISRLEALPKPTCN